ncbi:MAG TPA: GntR family transcriptional regulator [Lachnospiraceae bacterium]|nr:GntR family transcriptional regulator [Lachnospiraceae bacterium]
MAWKLDNNRAIYLQIIEEIQMRIVAGFYQPGSKLPSVRELAADAAVNPNTMQKALSELENGGLIITMRTSGRIVTENTAVIQNLRKKIASEEVKLFLKKMDQYGFNKQEITGLIQDSLKGEQHEQHHNGV